MTKTTLYNEHLKLGAKIVPFAGFQMPVSYTNIREEHITVRKDAGVFDVSHMGEFIVRGKQALDLVQSISSNDASNLDIGDAQYSCLPNDTGGIIDDMLVYRLDQTNCMEGESAYMLVVNASNIKKDWDWINRNINNYDCEMINISKQTGLLAIQGPNAVKKLEEICDFPIDLKYYTFKRGNVANIPNVIISATGYTGAGGVELYCNNKYLVELFGHILRLGIKPIGLGARDTLRLEKGYCLYGNDIDHTTSPIEAGLSWITKLKKKVKFPSKEYFMKQKQDGIEKKLIGFTTTQKRVPRQGYKIYSVDEKLIGKVTSGTMSPSLNHPIGMGYVNLDSSKVDTQIYFEAGKKLIPAKICKLPFL